MQLSGLSFGTMLQLIGHMRFSIPALTCMDERDRTMQCEHTYMHGTITVAGCSGLAPTQIDACH